MDSLANSIVKELLINTSQLMDKRNLELVSLQRSGFYDEILNKYLSTLKPSPHTKLGSNKNHLANFQNTLRLVYCKKTILFSIDVEAWERNTKNVTEIGVVIYDPREQVSTMFPVFKKVHIRVKEYLSKKNGRFVPDHSRNAITGVSYILTIDETVKFVQGLIDLYFNVPEMPAALVGHGVSGDVSWFSKLGIHFPDNPLKVDTQTLYSLTKGERRSSLKMALRRVDIPFAFLHNALNDAYYTLILAIKLCDPGCRVMYNLDVPDTEEAQNTSAPKVEPLPRAQRKKLEVSQANIAQEIELTASGLLQQHFLTNL